MDKSIKTKARKHNSMAINSLAVKYGFSKQYIRDVLTDNRTPLFADKIKQEYKRLDIQMSKILNNNEI